MVGTLTVLVDFLSYRFLIAMHLGGTGIAKTISFLLGTAFSYFANRLWTFGQRVHIAGTPWRFALLYALTLGANVAVNASMLDLFNSLPIRVGLAFVIATGVSAVANFVGMKWFVFRTVRIAEQ